MHEAFARSSGADDGVVMLPAAEPSFDRSHGRTDREAGGAEGVSLTMRRPQPAR